VSGGELKAGSADSAGATPQSRSLRARRTALALAVLAGVFYFGIMLIMAWR
jgi:hypothetical protein